MELTLGATPSTDVAGVVVGQDLVGRGKDTKLDVVVEGGVRGQTQKSNVVSEELDQNVNAACERGLPLSFIPDSCDRFQQTPHNPQYRRRA